MLPVPIRIPWTFTVSRKAGSTSSCQHLRPFACGFSASPSDGWKLVYKYLSSLPSQMEGLSLGHMFSTTSQSPAWGTSPQLLTVVITLTHTLYWHPSLPCLTFPLSYWCFLVSPSKWMTCTQILILGSASGGTQPGTSLYIRSFRSMQAISQGCLLFPYVSVGSFFTTEKNLAS